MREACKKAGFDGLYILGEYRGTDPKVLTRYKNFGLDYTFAYCWYVPNSPQPNVVIDTQLDYIRKTQEMHDIIPQVVTLSQAWSGWSDEGSVWKLPPADFETLLRRGKEFVETNISKDELGSKLMILDNWNEWSEGHYLAPYREYGFGYLDAVRRVFADDAEQTRHDDLIPADIGLGPYDLPQKLFENRTAWSFVSDNPASRIENGYQNWGPMMNVNNFRIENNRLHFETTTTDPAIRVPQNRTPATNFRKVVFRMKTTTPKNERLQFFWKTETAKDFSEAAGVETIVRPSDDFVDYSLDLSQNIHWAGRITELRLDPVSTPGVTVEFEFIRLE
jgi:hypothetical protein